MSGSRDRVAATQPADTRTVARKQPLARPPGQGFGHKPFSNNGLAHRSAARGGSRPGDCSLVGTSIAPQPGISSWPRRPVEGRDALGGLASGHNPRRCLVCQRDAVARWVRGCSSGAAVATHPLGLGTRPATAPAAIASRTPSPPRSGGNCGGRALGGGLGCAGSQARLSKERQPNGLGQPRRRWGPVPPS